MDIFVLFTSLDEYENRNLKIKMSDKCSGVKHAIFDFDMSRSKRSHKM